MAELAITEAFVLTIKESEELVGTGGDTVA